MYHVGTTCDTLKLRGKLTALNERILKHIDILKIAIKKYARQLDFYSWNFFFLVLTLFFHEAQAQVRKSYSNIYSASHWPCLPIWRRSTRNFLLCTKYFLMLMVCKYIYIYHTVPPKWTLGLGLNLQPKPKPIKPKLTRFQA